MFTGMHPGHHGYVGTGVEGVEDRPIDPAVTTLPELLTENGYKCSAVASSTFLLPEFGFGRGFHRFRANIMNDWVRRDDDARTAVDQITEWLDEDVANRDHSLFYFLHVYDPHHPYLPPTEYLDDTDLDLSRPAQYKDDIESVNATSGDYLQMYQNDHNVDSALIEDMRRYHRHSIRYTVGQIRRFVDRLRTHGVFDDALILVTGDHGQEFGERGFFLHRSLYDRNIRQFMAVKPPASADWSVPDTVDTIDFLPTIAHEIGVDIPEQSPGEPLQTKTSVSEPRFCERIRPDTYTVSVERDGTKSIFTYESNYPDRPEKSVIENGPVLKEFYDIAAVRDDEFSQLDSPPAAEELRSIAATFVLTAFDGATTDPGAVERPPQETRENLEDLGYL